MKRHPIHTASFPTFYRLSSQERQDALEALYDALQALYHALPPEMDGHPAVEQAYRALVQASGEEEP